MRAQDEVYVVDLGTQKQKTRWLLPYAYPLAVLGVCVS